MGLKIRGPNMSALHELCLEITNQCIMNCVHCSTASNFDDNIFHGLSLKEIKSIIIDFKFLGGLILELSGGEPTIHPALPDIVSFSKNLGLEVRLYTCGVSCQNGFAPLNEKFLIKLKSLGLDKIIFNLQGPNSDVHEQITRRRGSFLALLESIRIAKMLGFWVGAHFVPMKPNFESIQDVIEMADILEIDEVALLRFVPQGRGKFNESRLRLSKLELWEFLRKVAKIRKEYANKIHLRTGCPLDFLSFIDPTVNICSCKAGKSTCSITPSGDVIPCPGFKHVNRFVAGNIKSESLKFIWQDSAVFNQLRELDYHNISGCNQCTRIEICRGRCVVQRFRQHGDIWMGPDPDCFGPHPQKDNILPSICAVSKIEKISELLIS
jgi:radical SAM protein with 4Fe4S-binding SPASM domain